MAQNSAGVYVRESDESQRAVTVSSSIGAIVGRSNRGRIGAPRLITSQKQFLAELGIPDASIGFMHYCALAFLDQADQLYVTRIAPGALYGGLRIYTGQASMSYGAQWTAGQATPANYAFASNDLFTAYAIDPGAWNNTLSLVVYPNTVDNDGTFTVEVYVAGTNAPVETFTGCSLNKFVDGSGRQANIESRVNRFSSYIRVVQNRANTLFAANPSATLITTLTSTPFAGGSDGSTPVTGDYITGWEQYRDPEKVSVNILINAGLTAVPIQQRMEQIARARMDSVAVLDVPSDEQEVQDAVDWRRNVLALNSTYAALYSCDVEIVDEFSSRRLFVPPSGIVAGVYALTDRVAKLWYAPAGIDRGSIKVLSVAQTYDQGARDILDANQINMLRVIPGTGIVIWGADTMQTSKSALSNVNVRRLMNYIEASIAATNLYAVFNPNNSALRTRLVEIAARFLQPIQDGEGIYGYGVTCDDSNNPPASIANGDLILDLYVDPVIPAKRILITATINKTGVKFTSN